MARDLHQLDLFGNDMNSTVHIAAPKPIKSNKQVKPATTPSYAAPHIVNQVAEDDLPLVSRSAQHLNTSSTIQKRGRKSFASMDAEMGKVNIPSAEILEKKLYYPIGEVAHWFNVNTSLIRYWEKEFKQIQPRKTRKGDRLFRVQDIELLKQIHFLLREKKYSIDGAKTYLKNNKEKAEKNIAVLNSLKNLKSFLTTLKENL
ncbi:MAG: MerR family transcriptional regulator [Bacteroidetes bacterium]|nr:MerR family transcriptional regulator [Bacteroidota bacterium]